MAYIEHDVEPDFKKHVSNWSTPVLYRMVALFQERVKTLKELADEVRGIHERPHEFLVDISAYKQPLIIEYLAAFQSELEALEDVSHESVDGSIKNICQRFGISMPQIAQPLRVALTGKSSSPGVAHLIAVLGKDESIHRIGYFHKMS